MGGIDFTASLPHTLKSATSPGPCPRWVERWIREGGAESEEATIQFFEEIGSTRGLKDWQFRQALFSVEL